MASRIQIYESRGKRAAEIKAAKEALRDERLERLQEGSATKQREKSGKERLRQLRIEEHKARVELRLNGHPPEKVKNKGKELTAYAEYLISAHWIKRREDYLSKHPCCCICGTYLNLNVHHIWYWRDGKSILYCERDSDLRTLCKREHKKLHYYNMEKLFHSSLNFERRKQAFIDLPEVPLLLPPPMIISISSHNIL